MIVSRLGRPTAASKAPIRVDWSRRGNRTQCGCGQFRKAHGPTHNQSSGKSTRVSDSRIIEFLRLATRSHICIAAPEAMEIRLDQRELLSLWHDPSAGIICKQRAILSPNDLRTYKRSNPMIMPTARGGEDIAVLSHFTLKLIGDGGPAKRIAFRRAAHSSSECIANCGRTAGEVTSANEACWRNPRLDRPRL